MYIYIYIYIYIYRYIYKCICVCVFLIQDALPSSLVLLGRDGKNRRCRGCQKLIPNNYIKALYKYLIVLDLTV